MKRKVPKGFTLVELLVVIAIIGVLVALLLPAVQAAREAARRSQCSNNLKQCAIALHNYHDVYLIMPPAGWATGGTFGRNGLSWVTMVLPFFEQGNLHAQINFADTTYSNANRGAGVTQLKTMICPSSRQVRNANAGDDFTTPSGPVEQTFTMHYYGILGPKGPIPNITPTQNYAFSGPTGHGQFGDQGSMGWNKCLGLKDFTDGTSTTFLLGELSWENANCYRNWVRGLSSSTSHPAAKNVLNGIGVTPYNGSNNFNDVSFGAEHPGGCQFALGDASVRFVSKTIDIIAYRAAASRDGGEALPLQ